MTFSISRTCTRIDADHFQLGSGNSPRPLDEYRETAAYVLLGAPGAGKTTAFKRGSEDCPNGHYVTARDFITFGERPEWHGKTLFIDGLDEIRAGATDGRTQLDAIRCKLNALHQPRFRLSCREAHWLGSNDSSHLAAVSPDGKVEVLRLDPLTEDDVRKMLDRRQEIDDGDAFLAAARERGIGELLTNPMNLELLTRVVAGDVWPESRTQTFELACGMLVREDNEEHRLAGLTGHDVPRLMDGAGQVCATQLLTGVAGYSLSPGAADDHDFPGLEQIPGDDRNLLRRVLCTKLFAVPDRSPGQGRVAPAHRHIAEFMAARYLASLIRDGLPVRRILALITGFDGGVVSEMRGLSAWLAVHSTGSRAVLIARDPLGTVLHGDVNAFSTEDKRRLLDVMETHAASDPWSLAQVPPDARLGDLVTPDMVGTFGQLLSASARDHTRQPFAFILLAILLHIPAIPELAEILLAIVRDADCRPGMRREALDVLVTWTRNDGASAFAPEALLSDIANGTMSDPSDDLLGTLLGALYPTRLSVSEIMPYLREPRIPSDFGRFRTFWRQTVPGESSPLQLAECLDAIANNLDGLRPALVAAPGGNSPLTDVPALLLDRLLGHGRAELPANRLIDWLGAISGLDPGHTRWATRRIRDRLGSDKRLLEDLVGQAVERCSGSPDFARCMIGMERRLLGIPWPPQWCLEQAATAADGDVADWLVRRVADFVHHNPDGAALSRHHVECRLRQAPQRLRMFNDRLAVLAENDAMRNSPDPEDDSNRAVRRREWRDSLEPHLPSLRENRGQPGVLHHLAQVYFGDFIDLGGDSPWERFRDLAGEDETLARTAFAGLRRSVYRSDLPGAPEVARLGAQNRFHYLALPFMAGLEEAVPSASCHGVDMTEGQMRLGLAIHFADPNYSSMQHTPGWLDSVLDARPDLVADVLIGCARPLLQAGVDPANHFFDLARSPGHAAIASLAWAPLLKAFPTRCTNSQLPGLGFLLQAALRFGDTSSLLVVVDRKLTSCSMNVSQRVYWLSAGLLASPDTYLSELRTYVAGSERRVRHLAEFLAARDFPAPLMQQLDPPALQLLVQVLGTAYRPRTRPSGRVYRIDHSMQVSDRVEDFVNRLAAFPSRSASEALDALMCHAALEPWHTHLAYARHRQNSLRRETCFRHCPVDEVVGVLANRRPANAADLAALTLSHLQDIAGKIRDGNTSDWRQYWNVDRYNRPREPKPENACRDALLSDLQARLAGLHVDALPEGRYADDKRSDIRVSHGGVNVPVEIKKDSHRDLWSAIRTQLIANYSRDPETGGYGIYLVFWFGAGRCPPPESGEVPKDPAMLEERLQATLSPGEKGLISICVIDVSPTG